MTNYDILDIDQLVSLLNARDIEIDILSQSCGRLLKENARLKRKITDFALDYGLDNYELDEFMKDEKDPDSGFEGSTLFPKGEGRKVFENEAGVIHKWD